MPNDEFEDYEEQFHKSAVGSGKKPRSSKSKTSKAARNQAVVQARQNRKEETKQKIAKIISEFPEFEQNEKAEEFVIKYVKWINTALDSGVVLLDEELEEKFTRSSGAGGQNVNKVSTAVRLVHTPTNIHVRSDKERKQGRNREEARKQLTQKLGEHVKDWENYLEGGKKVDKTQVSEILA